MSKAFWYSLVGMAVLLAVLLALVEFLKTILLTVDTAKLFIERKTDVCKADDPKE